MQWLAGVFEGVVDSGSMIPPEFIQGLLEATDLEELISEDIDVRNRRASCPFHEDRKPSFWVDARKGRWTCYSCHAYGNAIDWIRKLHDMTFHEAVAHLAERVGMSVPGSGPKEDRNIREARENARRAKARKEAQIYGLCDKIRVARKKIYDLRWEMTFDKSRIIQLQQDLRDAQKELDAFEIEYLELDPEAIYSGDFDHRLVN